MTNKKRTKRALLMSVLSLMLCISMLIGTTYAWFTDSVTSSGNIIKSGTLDVTMEWKDATATGAQTTYKDASEAAIFNYDLWEPGYVEAKNIKIGNAGTLALKYQLNIVATGEVSELADVIDVYYAEGEYTLADRNMSELTNIGTLSQVLAQLSNSAKGDLLAGQSDTVTLALKMQESAGNEYQGLSIGSEFAVQLLATQLTSETDSFDNQYDADAPHTLVTTADELVAAVAEGGLIMLKEDIELSDILVVNKSGTVINGDGNTLTSTAGRAINVSGVDGVTITNLTIDCSGERAINVIQNATNVEIDSVTATSANYTVNVAASAGAAKVAISNSTLTGANAINVAGSGAYVTVDNSVVNCVDNSSVEGYSAVCLNKDATNGTIIVTDTQINITGTDTEGSFVAHNEADNGYISIDGSTEDVVVAVAYIAYGDYYYGFESLEEAIKKATNEQTIGLLRDIEMDVADTGITIAKDTTRKIDLNGHNITATSASAEGVQLFSVSGTLEIVGNGTVSLTNPDYVWTTSYRYTAINIRETGVVTLGDGVNVVCTTGENTEKGYGMCYAVDIYKEGTLNVNGASLHSNYIAVRCFYGASVVNVNSGSSITSSKNNWGIWPQSATGAVITIADGISYTTDDYGIYIFD